MIEDPHRDWEVYADQAESQLQAANIAWDDSHHRMAQFYELQALVKSQLAIASAVGRVVEILTTPTIPPSELMDG